MPNSSSRRLQLLKAIKEYGLPVIEFLIKYKGVVPAVCLSILYYVDSTREWILNILRDSLLTPPIQYKWQTILFAMLLIVLVSVVVSRLYHLLFRSKKDYFFVPYGGLKFKANKTTGGLDESFYCPVHQISLVEMSNTVLFCAICHSSRFRNLPIPKELSKKFAASIAKAITGCYIKNRSPFIENLIINIRLKLLIRALEKEK
jgi:hypothetical protein